MKIISIIIVLIIVALGYFDTAYTLGTSVKRSSHLPEDPRGGHWKTRTEWKGNWVKNWIPRTIYVSVWKRVWTPVTVNEWIPYVPAHH